MGICIDVIDATKMNVKADQCCEALMIMSGYLLEQIQQPACCNMHQQ